MSERERHTPDGAAFAARPLPAAGRSAPPSPDPLACSRLACLWDELFHHAPHARQQDLLTLARPTGVLYAHQLPPPPNGSPAPARRPLPHALLNGSIDDLEPLPPPSLDGLDPALDPDQREAVARAASTPDVFLIQGYPGSGKSRVTAEIVARAAARGERVLLLAPTAAAVDCVLERLACRDEVCAARCLAADERLETLAPSIRGLVFAERLRAFHDQTLPAARQAVEAARRLGEARRGDEAVWGRLEEMAARQMVLAEQARALAERRSRVAAEAGADAAVANGDSPFQKALACFRAARDAERVRLDAREGELRAEAEKVRVKQEAVTAEAEQCRPLAEARSGGRWWTAAWWRAAGKGDLAVRVAGLEKQRQELEEAAARVGRDLKECVAARAAAEARCEEECGRLRAGEEARRLAELEDQIAAAVQEQDLLRDKWATACRELSPGVAPPAEATTAAVRAARAAWDERLLEDERQAAAARQWAEAVEAALDTLPERMGACVNVVAAVTSALSADPTFGEQASPPATFDLLILDEAHLVAESDFLHLARRARRWVLVGEPTEDPDAAPLASRKSGLPRPARPSTLRPGFFQRLWRRLHADPRGLPSAWFHRGGRLVCRFRAPAPEEEQWIESEPVADRPEIELRIAAPPRKPPQLLEVVFPGSTALPDAKEYLFRELGELPVQARGSCFRWSEDADKVAMRLTDAAHPDAVAIALAPGVRERLGSMPLSAGDAACGTAPWQTCALEFDRAAGWTRERAEKWVQEHLKTRNPGRTALLSTPHRCRPELARFLADLLFDGSYRPEGPPAGRGAVPAVEFVLTPAPAGGESRRRADGEGRGRRGGTATVAPRARSAPGGAGLEIDLSDPRCPLPADLRASLPAHGLVNLAEARAVVRRLEGLAADPDFRAAAAVWSGPHRPAVAVMALYPAQTALLGRLVQQSAALAASPVAVEIGTPDVFRHRECLAALVSLTRSHTHRAVAYGEGPRTLLLALTRGADRLILFGDPGTLARRVHWQGAVDHLDEAAAERERGLIARLVAYLDGRGAHPETFRLNESGGV